MPPCNCSLVATEPPLISDSSHLLLIVCGGVAVMALLFLLCEILSKTQNISSKKFALHQNHVPTISRKVDEKSRMENSDQKQTLESKQAKRSEIHEVKQSKSAKEVESKRHGIEQEKANLEEVETQTPLSEGANKNKAYLPPPPYIPYTRTIPAYPLSSGLVSQARMPWRYPASTVSNASAPSLLNQNGFTESSATTTALENEPVRVKSSSSAAQSSTQALHLATRPSPAAPTHHRASSARPSHMKPVTAETTSTSEADGRRSVSSSPRLTVGDQTLRNNGASSPRQTASTVEVLREAKLTNALVQTSAPPKPKRSHKEEEQGASQSYSERIDISPEVEKKTNVTLHKSHSPEIGLQFVASRQNGKKNVSTEKGVEEVMEIPQAIMNGALNNADSPMLRNGPTALRRPASATTFQHLSKIPVADPNSTSGRSIKSIDHNSISRIPIPSASSVTAARSTSIMSEVDPGKSTLGWRQPLVVTGANATSEVKVHSPAQASSTEKVVRADSSSSENGLILLDTNQSAARKTTSEMADIRQIENALLQSRTSIQSDSKMLAEDIMTRLFRGQQESDLLFQQIKLLEGKMELMSQELAKRNESQEKVSPWLQRTELDDLEQSQRSLEYIEYEVSRGFQTPIPAKPMGNQAMTQIISLEVVPKWSSTSSNVSVRQSLPQLVSPQSFTDTGDLETLSWKSDSPDSQNPLTSEIERSRSVQSLTQTSTNVTDRDHERNLELIRREYDRQLMETVEALRKETQQRLIEEQDDQRCEFLKRESTLQQEIQKLASSMENQGSALSNLHWKLNKFQKNIQAIVTENELLENCTREVRSGWGADKEIFEKDKLRLEAFLLTMQSERQELRKSFDHLIDVKVALDAELKQYKGLVEEEEQRYPLVHSISTAGSVQTGQLMSLAPLTMQVEPRVYINPRLVQEARSMTPISFLEESNTQETQNKSRIPEFRRRVGKVAGDLATIKEGIESQKMSRVDIKQLINDRGMSPLLEKQDWRE